uniref:Uncharacterized protein n=1 Tax=Coccolithus braarudii TaxID=221442 RepID=A0A7S0LA84_9EUKA|mmetsp:Transcript_2686/g.5589  ORF Transcript_2686/g.5589 Transcript_2686/m.5589 type:complete len:152 (+) Transcript_2686:314-769(+)
MLQFVTRTPRTTPAHDKIEWYQRTIRRGTTVMDTIKRSARPGNFVTHKTKGKVQLLGAVGTVSPPVQLKVRKNIDSVEHDIVEAADCGPSISTSLKSDLTCFKKPKDLKRKRQSDAPSKSVRSGTASRRLRQQRHASESGARRRLPQGTSR